MRREYALVVDVETAGGFGSPLVYDLGVAVVARTSGEIVESLSLIIADVFVGMPEAMQSAYYAEKIPQYRDGLRNGTFRMVKYWTAWRMVRALVERYNIRRVYAYNARFDRNALNNTMRVLTEGKYHNFFPRGIEICCIWHMACQTILSQKRYRKYAHANNLVSDFGNIRTSAEAAYGYIINDPNYSEPHTGLADVEIETEILHKVIRQHKRVDESPRWNCWKIPQKEVA